MLCVRGEMAVCSRVAPTSPEKWKPDRLIAFRVACVAGPAQLGELAGAGGVICGGATRAGYLADLGGGGDPLAVEGMGSSVGALGFSPAHQAQHWSGDRAPHRDNGL